MTPSANRFFKIPVIVLLSLVPLFLASERPFFWAFWSFITLFMFAMHVALVANDKIPLVPMTRSIWIISAAYAVIILAVAIQTVPLGALFGDISFDTNGDTVLLSNYLSLTPGDSLLGLFRWLTYGAVFYLFLHISFRNEGRARSLMRAVVFIVFFYASYSLVALTQFNDTIIFLEKWAYQGFATGTFVNRNSFATFLGMGGVVCLTFLFEPFSKTNDAVRINAKRQIFLTAAFVVMMFALIQTGSRLGAFSTFCAIAFLILTTFRLAWSVPAIILSCLMGAVVIALSGDNTSMFDRIVSTGSDFGSRLALYQDIWPMILSKPLFGFGMDSFEYAYPIAHSENVNQFLVWNLAHSTYLANWFELGLIFGSLPILIFVLLGGVMARSMVTKSRTLEVKAALGCLILVAIHSLFDFSLEIHANAIFITAILALGSAATLRKN